MIQIPYVRLKFVKLKNINFFLDFGNIYHNWFGDPFENDIIYIFISMKFKSSLKFVVEILIRMDGLNISHFPEICLICT